MTFCPSLFQQDVGLSGSSSVNMFFSVIIRMSFKLLTDATLTMSLASPFQYWMTTIFFGWNYYFWCDYGISA